MKRTKTEKAGSRRPDNRDAEVGRRIRALRLERELSQTELGLKIGVTFQQLQKYEKGINRIGASRLESIASALGVPISFFFNQEQTASSNRSGAKEMQSVFNLVQSSGAVRVVKAFHKIKSARARQTLVQMCEVFASSRP